VLVSELAQVVFSVPAAAGDAVGNLLTEEGGGIEQRDAESTPTLGADTVELVVWLPGTEVERRVQQVEKLLVALKEMGTVDGTWTWRSSEADPKSWLEAYKLHFGVNHIGRYFVVKPSWESYQPQPADLLIEMDPGMAFGTGLHASTRLVLSALERVARSGPAPQTLLDLGCGTGILAIAAARLWSSCRIYAVDNDEQAVRVCRENVQRNGLEARIHVELRSGAKVDGRHQLVLANLHLEALVELQPRMRRIVEPYGRLVLSGLLAEQAGQACRHYCRELAFEPEYSEELDGWQALLLRARD
jgi:ribosomal protein L11 methyltransferase